MCASASTRPHIELLCACNLQYISQIRSFYPAWHNAAQVAKDVQPGLRRWVIVPTFGNWGLSRCHDIGLHLPLM